MKTIKLLTIIFFIAFCSKVIAQSSLTISAPSATIANNATTINFTITYTGATAVTLNETFVTINHTGTAGGTILVEGSGTATRTVKISGVTGDGSYTISIAAGSSTDGTTPDIGAGPSGSVSVDNTAPSAPIITGITTGSFNTNQTFTVTGEGGATIEYTIDGSNWLAYSGAVTLSAENTYPVQARQTDLAGNGPTTSATITVIIDKTAPAAPAISGISSGSFNTNQTFTVVGEGGATIEYTIDGSNWLVYSGAVTLSAENTYPVQARQTDLAGNGPTTSATITVIIDKTAPAAPTISGIFSGSFNVNQSFTVAGEGGATIEYTIDGSNWLAYSGAVTLSAENTYPVQARQTDLAGNGPATSATITVIIDKTAPAAPTISGISSGSFNTNQTFTVVGEGGATIEYTIDGSNWLVYSGAVTLSAENTYPVQARQTDLAGNGPTTSATITVIIDKTAPAAPTISGIFSGSFNVNQSFTVAGEGGATIEYTIDGSNWLAYSGAVTLSAENTYPVQARQTDLAGNSSATSATITVIIDKTAPTVSNVSSTVPNGTYKIGDIIPITIIFNDNMSVTGTPRLTLETGTIDQLVDFTSVSTNTLTFNYTVQANDVSGDLNYVNTTSLALNSGTIKDIAGNNATITLPATGSGSSLGGSKAIVVDGVVPTVTNVSSTRGNGYAKLGDLVPITITFSENINVIGTPQLTLETGTTDRVVDFTSVSTNTLTFNYTVQTGDLNSDLTYVATNSLALNSGTIKDLAGNDATITLPSPLLAGSLYANKNIDVDGVVPAAPTISGITSGTYNTNQTFTVTGAESNKEYSYNNGGSWSTYSSARTISAEGTYDVIARQTDAAGNVSPSSTLYSVIIDKTTQAPTLTSPADNSTSTSFGDITITYNLPEAALGGTVVLTFDCTDAPPGYSSLSDRFVTLKPICESVGVNTFTLDARNFLDPVNSTWVLSATTSGSEGNRLINGGTYRVYVEYQDFLGNSVASDNNSNIFFSSGPPLPDIIDVTPDPRNYNIPSIEGVTLKFNWRVNRAQVQIDHFTLTRDAVNVPLTGVTITPNEDYSGYATEFKLDLSGITNIEGTYVLTFDPTGTLSTPILDRTGNAVVGGASDTWVTDLTSPSVVLTDNHSDAIVRDADNVTITATFSEDIFTTPTITIGSVVTSVAMAATADNKVWTYLWDVPSGNYTSEAVSISAIDNAGNSNTAATGKISYKIDNLAPNVSSINRVSTTPTNLNTVDFLVTFDETVNNVLTTNFSLSGTAVGASISSVSSGSGATRTVSILTGGTDGTLLLNLTTAAGITDDAGNSLAGPRSCDQSYTVDKTFPELNAITIASNNLLHPTYVGVGGVVTLTITGSENLVIVNGDIQIEGQNATISGSNKNWTATYTMQNTDVVNPVTYKIDFKDLAGNTVTGVVTPSTIIFDKVAPTITSVTIESSNIPSNTAKVGDVITILFTADDDIENVAATINATPAKNAVVTSLGSRNWKAEYTMPSSGIAEGIILFDITFRDYAGNLGSFTSTALNPTPTVTFDKTAPSVPSKPNLVDASDTGTSNSDEITSITTPTFSGTSENNALIKLYSNIDGAIGTVNADGSGVWSTPVSALTSGNHIITATATDATGNTSSLSLALTLTIDVTQPAVPGIPGLDPASNSGLTTDNITSDNTPTLVGTAESYSVITIFSGVTLVGTTTTDLYGIWTVTTSVLAEGSHSITAKATDLAGNTNTTASSVYTIIIDGIAPSTPTAPNLDAISDSGTSNIDNITNITTLTFTGNTETGSTVKIYSNVNGLVGTGIADGSGDWTITTSTLSPGAHSITTTSTDVAANLSGVSTALPISIDITAPVAPSAPNMDDASDSGTSNTDNITNIATPMLSGTTEANAIIKLYSNVSGYLVSGVADGSGNWSIPCPLTEQNHSITATATDASGNVSVFSPSISVIIDQSAPVISSISVPSGDYRFESSILVTIQANDKTYVGQTIEVNGNALSLVNLNNNSYTVTYVVQAADVNYLTPRSTLPVNIVLRDVAGNINTAITNADVVGGTGLLTINNKPTYTITGTASRCDGTANLPVTITFTGKAPFTYTYYNGTANVSGVSATTSLITPPLASGTVTMVSLTDASTNSATIDAGINATITQIAKPVITLTPTDPLTLTYTKTDTEVNLNGFIASAAGGNFSGLGVGTDKFFYPSLIKVLDVINPITYTYTDPGTTCSNSKIINIIVSASGASITAFPSFYCKVSAPTNVPITISNAGVTSNETFTLSPAVSPTLAAQTGKYDFWMNPNGMAAGSYTLKYHYKNETSGIEYDIIRNFKIIQINSALNFTMPSASFCKNDPTIYTLSAINETPDGTANFSSKPASGSGLTSLINNQASFTPSLVDLGSQPYKDLRISYKFTTTEGACESDSIHRVVRVYAPPVVSFALKDNYNFDGAQETLVGIPSGGTFTSDKSIIIGGNIIKPKNISLSDIGNLAKVTYTYTDPSTSCTGKIDNTTIVYKATEEIMSGGASMSDKFCYENSAITITCEPIADGLKTGTFTSLKNAITGNTGNSAQYDIGMAGNGTDVLTFTYYVGASNTKYEIVKNVVIDDIGDISLNIVDNSNFCKNVTSVPIYGIKNHSNGNGVFTIFPASSAFSSGSSNATFIPALESIGKHTITYTYTSNIYNSCTKSITRDIWVNPVPKAKFSIAEACPGTTDSVQLVNSSIIPVGASMTWSWNIEGQPKISDKIAPKHLFKSIGDKPIVLSAITDKGCTHDTTRFFTVGISANADFIWNNECLDGSSIQFNDKSTGGTVDRSRWIIGNDTIGYDKNLTYNFNKLGKYDIKLAIKTQDRCVDTVVKQIVIQPYIKFQELPNLTYYQNFDTTGSYYNWQTKGISDAYISRWDLGKPNGQIIDISSSGSSSWFTKLTNKTDVENSQVVSPCFDFTGLKKPMIKLNIWSSSEPKRDGAVLQYSIDKGNTWTNLGTKGKGINWYNSDNIISRPAVQDGEVEGWSQVPMTEWTDARYNLDTLLKINHNNVRFRIAYASDGNGVAKVDGFAFDDVLIGEREQKVLGEYFTNSTIPASVVANDYLKSYEAKDSLDFIPIHYHTNGDILYNNYTAGPSSRSYYYGISDYPSILSNGLSKSNLSLLDRDEFENYNDFQTLKDPLFAINFISDKLNGIRVTAKDTIKGKELVLLCAIVRKSVTAGGVIYNNVITQFIPNPGGSLISKSNWLPNEKEDIWVPLSIENTDFYRGSKLVVFVQDARTREVYQAISEDLKGVATSIKPTDISNLVTIYPNPATSNLVVECEYNIDRLVILDITGRIISDYTPKQQQFIVPVESITNGVYIVKGSTKKGDFIKKFVKQ